MKKFSKKGILLFAAAMALCAFMMPSMAGAASWTTVGTHHTLDSPNVGFSSANAGGITSACTQSSFTTRVVSTANMEIVGASFGGHCTATGPGIGTCTSNATPTALPWTATAVTTSNIQIHGINIDVVFSGASCLAAGAALQITGTVTGGTWNAAERALILTNAHGLVSHSAAFGANQPVAARGTFRDTQQTLTVDN